MAEVGGQIKEESRFCGPHWSPGIGCETDLWAAPPRETPAYAGAQ